MNKDRTDELIKFLREESGNYDTEISLKTLIEDDLGVTGDDGIDLINHYSELFDVDISKFIYSKYFYPEPSLTSTYETVIPLTVGDLEEAIKKGKLE